MSNIEFTRDLAQDESAGITLLIIDPQHDFHDNGIAGCGSLAVPGADVDAKKIADMIMKNKEKITNIYVTMDSHHKKHIAHHAFWRPKDPDAKVKKLESFTVLRHKFDDSKNLIRGCLFEYDTNTKDYKKDEDSKPIRWQPKDVSLKTWVTDYSKKLQKAKNGFDLVIWPDHCLIGTIGHSIQKDIQEALMEWNRDKQHCNKTIKYITKGMNCLTEMYSAIEAEVPIESDPATTVNEELLHALGAAQRLIVCGQAKSHCCNHTVRDIVKYCFGKEFVKDTDPPNPNPNPNPDPNPNHDAKAKPNKLNHIPIRCSPEHLETPEHIYLLKDGMSNVFGYDKEGDTFFEEMESIGVVLMNHDNPKLFNLPAHSAQSHSSSSAE